MLARRSGGASMERHLYLDGLIESGTLLFC